MEAREYVEKAGQILRSSGGGPARALGMAEEGLRKHLDSPDLWQLRGDLLRLCGEFDEVLECYERAATLDPLNPACFERIGQFHDAHTQDGASAERAYRNALDLGAGWRSVAGLGRILALSGREPEALALIRSSPHREQTDVYRLSAEIAEGSWSPAASK